MGLRERAKVKKKMFDVPCAPYERTNVIDLIKEMVAPIKNISRRDGLFLINELPRDSTRGSPKVKYVR